LGLEASLKEDLPDQQAYFKARLGRLHYFRAEYDLGAFHLS